MRPLHALRGFVPTCCVSLSQRQPEARTDDVPDSRTLVAAVGATAKIGVPDAPQWDSSDTRLQEVALGAGQAECDGPESFAARVHSGSTRPNQAWVTDITYIRTYEGWVYPATVIDLH